MAEKKYRTYKVRYTSGTEIKLISTSLSVRLDSSGNLVSAFWGEIPSGYLAPTFLNIQQIESIWHIKDHEE